MVDIKNEIEWTYGIKIDIDRQMNEVAKEISKRGQKVPKKELDEIKRLLNGKIKKKKDHQGYLTDTMYINGYIFNEHDEITMYETAHHHEEKKEIVLPATLVYGVTISLCGLFMCFVPIPVCQAWGPNLVMAGIGACASAICEEIDKKEKK